MNLHPTQVLVKPMITEKNNLLREDNNEYVFEVHSLATKPQIATAVEELFAVKVLQVRTTIARGKKRRVGQRVGRKSNYKKAFVQLREGHSIDFFEGL